MNTKENLSLENEAFRGWPVWICPLQKDVEGEKQAVNPYTNSAAVADDVDYAKREQSPLPEKRNENEFWNIYDKQWYDALRTKYHAAYLPGVYDKVRFD